MMKKTYQVEGMHCSNCAMNLEGIEDDLQGIRSIQASYVRSTMVVEFDESRVSEEQIMQAVKERGYSITTD